ncbi:hypothetical protein F0562_008986 [Nyssa sinensis]|uniref:EF-hand domain-containing protein n=1 Tax=Nyssa sinensis TaxID=561372 RepID=A0A5J5A6P5_9ASTE|nr:hypothetical protein F0562_008986 [Nyssa sinensis]
MSYLLSLDQHQKKKMGKFAKLACSTFVLLLVLAVTVTGRSLRHSSLELVSDGIDDVEKSQSSVVLLKGMDSSEECEQMYGILPCSNSLLGHLFLILVYEYLLFHGESYVASGGERIFKVLGPGVFGGSVFQVLGALPESLILLASGLSNTKETAQEYVLTGVGLLAGSTILLLTVLWGTCVVVGSRDFPNSSQSNSLNDSNPRRNSFQKLLSSVIGRGIYTDMETSAMARIMVLSVIPFIIIQIPEVFHLSSGEHIVIIVSLLVSVVFLLLYFFYQIFEPKIQERRLEFLKHEHFVLDILKHVQKQTEGRLLTADGAPNVPVIRRLFEEINQDRDDDMSFSQLNKLLNGIRFRKPYWDQDKATAKLEEFDLDGNRKITEEEFVKGFIKLLNETKRALAKRTFSKKSLHDIYRMVQKSFKKQKEHEEEENLISEFLKHIQNHAALESLLKEDGTPDIAAIKRLFESIDRDEDKCISQSELEELIRKIPMDADQVGAKIMENFDVNRDQVINEEEFVTVFANCLSPSDNHTPTSTESQDDKYRMFQKSFKKKKEHEEEENLMSEFLKHIQNHAALESLLKEDGTPDIAAIKRLFESIDRDEDKCISQSELEELIRKISMDADQVGAKIMENFDVNRDQVINEEEFVTVFANCLSPSDNHYPTSTESQDDKYREIWKDADDLVDERSVEVSPWAWIKAIMLLVLGIVILAVLAEPLIDSVQNFSKRANMPSFFISFILVPLATNARAAISAITTASQKKIRTTSLAFSEIYGGVFMNNILGFSVLLSLIYFRGLSWDFSAEVLAVLIVCAIMGIAASFSTAFPIWTSLVAFLLYPLSLLLVYVLEDFSGGLKSQN